jgi:hypothetical protein
MIPVEVREKAELASITVDANKETISNAYGKDYYGEITVTGYDTLGREMSLDTATMQIDDKDNTLGVISKAGARIENKPATEGFQYAGTKWTGATDTKSVSGSDSTNDNGTVTKKFFYNAWGADVENTKTLAFNITAKAKGKSEDDSVSITVESLDKDAWNMAGAGVNVTYAVELSDEVVDLGKFADAKTDAKLYAEVGNVFAGYVKNSVTSETSGAAIIGQNTNTSTDAAAVGTITNGAVKVKAGAAITNIRMAVKGIDSDYATVKAGVINIFDSNKNVSSGESAALKGTGTGNAANVTVKAYDAAQTTNYYAVGGDAEDQMDEHFARKGTYEIEFKYNEISATGSVNYNSDQDIKENFTVESSLDAMAPTIEYSELNVDSLTPSEIKKTLSTNVDMNNEKSYASIGSFYTYDASSVDFTFSQFKNAQKDNDKLSVDYMQVSEDVTVNPDKPGATYGVNFLVYFGNSFAKK